MLYTRDDLDSIADLTTGHHMYLFRVGFLCRNSIKFAHVLKVS